MKVERSLKSSISQHPPFKAAGDLIILSLTEDIKAISRLKNPAAENMTFLEVKWSKNRINCNMKAISYLSDD